MIRKQIQPLVLLALISLITACSALFDKDNTPEPKPLVDFKPQAAPHVLWTANAGSGVGKEYIKSGPAVSETAVYTSSLNGTITAVNKDNGRINWQYPSHLRVTTTPGIGEGLVVVGSSSGDVIALRQADGALAWKTSVPGELLAAPAIGGGRVILKAVDGYVRALSITDGHQIWQAQQVEPALILRGSSAPVIRDRAVIAGFANGSLAKYNLDNGQMQWMQSVAIPEGIFAIERMIDIDADPVVYNHRIYAATYQGKITSLEWSSGQALWSNDISSYTGMIADDNAIFVTDAKGHVWSFGGRGGAVNWHQTDLEARILTAPANMGNYVAVADAQGFIHWLDKRNGHFVARVGMGSPIYAAPVVDNRHVLYALTNSGYLVAYTLS